MGPVTTESDSPFLGPVPIVVYAAMFGATVVGQLVGMAADAVALGRRWLWVPLVCSVMLEALVGARLGGARIGRPLTWSECARVSAYYSIGLAALSVPLAVWTLASNHGLRAGVSSHAVVWALGVALAALIGATALRQAIMTLLSVPRVRLPRGAVDASRRRS